MKAIGTPAKAGPGDTSRLSSAAIPSPLPTIRNTTRPTRPVHIPTTPTTQAIPTIQMIPSSAGPRKTYSSTTPWVS